MRWPPEPCRRAFYATSGGTLPMLPGARGAHPDPAARALCGRTGDGERNASYSAGHGRAVARRRTQSLRWRKIETLGMAAAPPRCGACTCLCTSARRRRLRCPRGILLEKTLINQSMHRSQARARARSQHTQSLGDSAQRHGAHGSMTWHAVEMTSMGPPCGAAAAADTRDTCCADADRAHEIRWPHIAPVLSGSSKTCFDRWFQAASRAASQRRTKSCAPGRRRRGHGRVGCGAARARPWRELRPSVSAGTQGKVGRRGGHTITRRSELLRGRAVRRTSAGGTSTPITATLCRTSALARHARPLSCSVFHIDTNSNIYIPRGTASDAHVCTP